MLNVPTLHYILDPLVALMTTYKRLVELVEAMTSRVKLYSFTYSGCTRGKNITDGMNEYIRNREVCRRLLLMQPFLVS